MSNSDSKTPAEIFGAYLPGLLAPSHPATQRIGRMNEIERPPIPTVHGLYYNGKVISLDGYLFVGCRFDNCTLLLSSTNLNLVNCVIDATTTVQYGPDPLKVVQLFNSRTEWMYIHAPNFVPRKNADGTITINGIQQ